MTSQFAMSAMSVAEFLLWATLAFLFWNRKLYRRFPVMGAYLGLHVVFTPILLILYYGQSEPWGNRELCANAYFFGYFGAYIASAILLLFICIEIFRSALASFPGLLKIGIVIFRWAIVVSLIVTLSSISFLHRGLLLIPDIAYALMRSVSILELCLLAFLCLTINALRLSVRDLSFGIALGFGLMASNEFVLASLISTVSTHGSMITPLEFAYESLILISLGIWITYCALPERGRRPVMMPASSAIYRWNEIASALGHTGTQVAIQQPANSFFLTDVEKVVEKVLTRNLKGRESEL